jgi:hypothetical protein
MGQAALFIFGCVIFFIVGTGGFLYVTNAVRKSAEESR